MNTAIDSLKVRIPLKSVDVLKLDLLDYFADVNLNTGEIDTDNYKKRRFAVKEKGITTSYLVQKGGNASRQEDSLLIMLNSKLLKENYLEGITKNNLKKVFNELLKQQIVSFGYNTFLDARGTDIDIKTDNILEGESPLDLQMDLVKHLAKLTKPSTQKRKGYDMNKSATNLGIAWSKREVATLGSPYLKLYAKDIELIHNSHLFTEAFLGGEVQEGLTRIEGTIKNQKHFNSLLGIDTELTLSNLVSLTEAEMENIIKKMASKHIEQSNHLADDIKESWSLADGFTHWVLSKIESQGLALHEAQFHFKNKQQIYTARQQVKKIWQNHFADTEQGKRGKELDKVFSSLGIGEDAEK